MLAHNTAKKDTAKNATQTHDWRNHERLFVVGMALGLAALTHLSASAGTVNYTFKTDIQQVQAGNVNGQEYLTIQIPSEVGPFSCRGNVLALAIDERHDQNIETLAFSAMLQSDQVMITIPLSAKDCVDGKPTVLDLYLIHNS